MALRDKFKQSSGVLTVTEPASQPAAQASSATNTPSAETSLEAMRAKIKAGTTGGVNPPEASAAQLSVAPKTGPNGESVSGATEPSASTEISDTPTASAAAPEPVKGRGGRKPKSVTTEPATDAESFFVHVYGLQALLPAGVTLTITRPE